MPNLNLHPEKRRFLWIPIVFIIFSTLVLVYLWWSLEDSEIRMVQATTEVTAEQVDLRLEAWVATRINLIEYIGQTYGRYIGDSPFSFEDLALRYAALAPGFQAINWIDESWSIAIIVPEKGNEPALGQDLLLRVREILDAQGRGRNSSPTGTIHRGVP